MFERYGKWKNSYIIIVPDSIKVKKMYVADLIGDEYKSWRKGDKILITAHTGTGKTSFVLYKLIKRNIEAYIEKGYIEKILYLVNRKILKEQLEKELKSQVTYRMREIYGIDIPNASEFITITTYQSIENFVQKDIEKLKQLFVGYDIAVYDECHYFLAD